MNSSVFHNLKYLNKKKIKSTSRIINSSLGHVLDDLGKSTKVFPLPCKNLGSKNFNYQNDQNKRFHPKAHTPCMDRVKGAHNLSLRKCSCNKNCEFSNDTVKLLKLNELKSIS